MQWSRRTGDVSLGVGGLFNFAHLAFFGIGLYVCAILSKVVGLDPWLAIPWAGQCTMAAAALVSLPVIRLRGIYVVLVTFAFGQLVQKIVLSQADITGGSQLDFGHFRLCVGPEVRL